MIFDGVMGLWNISIEICPRGFFKTLLRILMKLRRIDKYNAKLCIELIPFWFDDFWQSYGTSKYLHSIFCPRSFFENLGQIFMKLCRIHKYNAKLCIDLILFQFDGFWRSYGTLKYFLWKFCPFSFSKTLGHNSLKHCKIDQYHFLLSLS